MWTLLNQDKNRCAGVFPTAEVAQKFADNFCPELGLTPVELLVNQDTVTALDESEFGWTFEEGDGLVVTIPLPGGMRVQ